MGKLQSGRSNVTDFIVGTPGFLGSAEQNIASIFGIPIDQEITGRIFETGDGTSSGVNTTGTIRGFLKFLSSNLASEIGNASGVVFQDTVVGTTYKIANVGDGLRLYSGAGSPVVWTEILNLATVADQFINLTDVDEADYTDHAGEFVKVNSAEDGLEFAEGGAVSGALPDLSDVPDYRASGGTPYPNRYLKVNAGATGLDWVTASGTGGSLAELSDVELGSSGALTLNSGGHLLEYVRTAADAAAWSNVRQMYGVAKGANTSYFLLATDVTVGGDAATTIPFAPRQGFTGDDPLMWNGGDNLITTYLGGFTPSRHGVYRLDFYFGLTAIPGYNVEFKMVTTSSEILFPDQPLVTIGGVEFEAPFALLGPHFTNQVSNYTVPGTGTVNFVSTPSIVHLSTTVWVKKGYEPFAALPIAQLKAYWQVPTAVKDFYNTSSQFVRVLSPHATAVRLR